ncbi:hypothetical protein GWR56_06915 [Mucilaginibacter sp. 14171R-50]|nr:hypothetical protein GWR56_06915 [Mucilaginibacter sp. 14171R-50]
MTTRSEKNDAGHFFENFRTVYHNSAKTARGKNSAEYSDYDGGHLLGIAGALPLEDS